jgi:hypothetical protein
MNLLQLLTAINSLECMNRPEIHILARGRGVLSGLYPSILLVRALNKNLDGERYTCTMLAARAAIS